VDFAEKKKRPNTLEEKWEGGGRKKDLPLRGNELYRKLLISTSTPSIRFLAGKGKSGSAELAFDSFPLSKNFH